MSGITSAFVPFSLWTVYQEGGSLRLIKEKQAADTPPYEFKWRLFDKTGVEVHAWSTGEPCSLSVRALQAVVRVSDSVTALPDGCLSAYRHQPKLLAQAEAEWADAERCSASFNTLCKGPVSLEGMTAKERTLYEFIANPDGPGSVPMVASLEPLITALCRRGVVHVTSEVYCRKAKCIVSPRTPSA